MYGTPAELYSIHLPGIATEPLTILSNGAP